MRRRRIEWVEKGMREARHSEQRDETQQQERGGGGEDWLGNGMEAKSGLEAKRRCVR